MYLPRAILSGMLLGGWAWLALCCTATAQDNQDATASARARWEQRVLQQSNVKQTGLVMGEVPQHRTARRWSPHRAADTVTGVRSVAMAAAEPGPKANRQSPPPNQSGADDQISLDPTPLVDQSDPFGQYDTSCDDCGMCGSVCEPTCDRCHRCGGCWWGSCGLGRYRRLVRDFSLFAGVHGFKGPADQGQNGNFGFHEGFNMGGPVGRRGQLAYQLGLQAVHSNFAGDRATRYRNGDRDQIFLTAGIFRRAVCGGFQWGVAFDLLHDAYYERVDLSQVRTELSYLLANRRGELGFWGAFETRAESVGQVSFQPNDMFAFFYRRHFCSGGEGRVWTGFTSDHDALVGGDIRVPLGRSWALENSLHYLIPGEGKGSSGQLQEAWSVNVQLVWYFGRDARCARTSRYRPLFGVADNSTFIAELR